MIDPAGVGDEHGRRIRVDLLDDRDGSSLRQCVRHLDRTRDDVANVENALAERQLAGLETRKLEQVVDDYEELLARFRDDLDIAPLRRAQFSFGENTRHADDRIHGRTNLMAHHRQEFRLRLVRSLGRAKRLAKSSLVLFALRNVTEHVHRAVVRGRIASSFDRASLAPPNDPACRGPNMEVLDHSSKGILRRAGAKTAAVGVITNNRIKRLTNPEQFRGGAEHPMAIVVPNDQLSIAIKCSDRLAHVL